MRKNVASQIVGAQMITAADGTAFTGSVTVYVTGDGGTQAAGSVGSGACTHEGNGFHTYAPAQAETNYDHVAFTFTGTGAVPVTVQVYTGYPQTGDAYGRIGAPVGASISADIAVVDGNVDAILVDTGTSGVAIADGSLTAAKFGSGAVTSTVLADGAITAAKLATDAITAAKIANGAIDAAAIATDAFESIADYVWDENILGHSTANSAGAVLQPLHSGSCQAGGNTTSVVLASSASSSDDYYNGDLVVGWVTADGSNKFADYISDYTGSTRTATVTGIPVSPDATYTYVVLPGGSIPGATAPSAADVADAVWDEASSAHVSSGTFGQLIGAPVTRTATAQGGTTSSITLDASASATNNLYRYHICEITAGTGAGQAGYVTAYNGSSKVATIEPAFTVAPSSDSVYVLRKLGLDAATPAQVADAVWDEARSGHTTAGTFGSYVNADVQYVYGNATAASNQRKFYDGTGYAGTNNVIPSVTTVTGNVNGNVAGSVGSVTGAVGSVTGAVGSVTGNVGGNVVGSVGSVTGNVGGDVVGAVGEVTAGVTLTTAGIDAILTRQMTESYAADGAAPTLSQALMLIQQTLGDFAISGTTLTVKQLDGTTTAATFTLDSGTAPTSITRSG